MFLAFILSIFEHYNCWTWELACTFFWLLFFFFCSLSYLLLSYIHCLLPSGDWFFFFILFHTLYLLVLTWVLEQPIGYLGFHAWVEWVHKTVNVPGTLSAVVSWFHCITAARWEQLSIAHSFECLHIYYTLERNTFASLFFSINIKGWSEKSSAQTSHVHVKCFLVLILTLPQVHAGCFNSSFMMWFS
jgi:hypothetical protein